MNATSSGKVYHWEELPATDLLGGTMRRTGFRGDDCLLTFNRIQPTMKRWEPHSHPFDQIVLTVEGTQVLEIEGETMVCEAGTIVRVPADAKHTGWPTGDAPVLNIDVFPPREDYLFLVKHQSEYPQPETETIIRHPQEPTDKEFTGKMKENTGDILFRWEELPREELYDGSVTRAGFRGDNALVVFNWIKPEHERLEPHSHPFDQLLLILNGHLMLEVDGKSVECDPGSIVHIPADAPHTGWVLGDQTVLNMDVFAPVREDYLHLTKYQKDYA